MPSLVDRFNRVALTAKDGRSRTSSTAVPGAVLTPPSIESCAARHLHVQVQWWKCTGLSGTIPAMNVRTILATLASAIINNVQEI